MLFVSFRWAHMWMLASPACWHSDVWCNPLIQSDALAASAASRVIIYRRDCRAAAKNISSPNLPELPGVEGPGGRNKRSDPLLLWGSLKAALLSSSCCYRLNGHHQPLSSIQPSIVVRPSNLWGHTEQSVKSSIVHWWFWGNILTSCTHCVAPWEVWFSWRSLQTFMWP